SCHVSQGSNRPVTYCEIAPPPAMQHASAPDANACSVFGKVNEMPFVAHTKMPACATPIRPQNAQSSVKLVAVPVAAVRIDHVTANAISAFLLPNKSAMIPAGIWNTA